MGCSFVGFPGFKGGLGGVERVSCGFRDLADIQVGDCCVLGVSLGFGGSLWFSCWTWGGVRAWSLVAVKGCYNILGFVRVCGILIFGLGFGAWIGWLLDFTTVL